MHIGDQLDLSLPEMESPSSHQGLQFLGFIGLDFFMLVQLFTYFVKLFLFFALDVCISVDFSFCLHLFLLWQQFGSNGKLLHKINTKLAVGSYGEDDLISLIQTLYIKQPQSTTSISGADNELKWYEYKIKETNMFTVDKYQQIGFSAEQKAFALRYQTPGMLKNVLRQGVLGKDDTGEESPNSLQIGFSAEQKAFALRYQTPGMLKTVLRQGVLGKDDTGEESPKQFLSPFTKQILDQISPAPALTDSSMHSPTPKRHIDFHSNCPQTTTAIQPNMGTENVTKADELHASNNYAISVTTPRSSPTTESEKWKEVDDAMTVESLEVLMSPMKKMKTTAELS